MAITAPTPLSPKGPGRAWRHWGTPSSRAAFPDALFERVARLVAEGETRHRGQVVLAVESRLPTRAAWQGQTPRQRASQVFSELRVWDTAANAGVLVYLLLADRAIEIVADRGLDGRVPPERWAEVCRLMEDDLRRDRYQEAALGGVARVSDLLAAAWPRELPEHDTPAFLAKNPGATDPSSTPALDGDPAIWDGVRDPGNELPDRPYRLD